MKTLKFALMLLALTIINVWAADEWTSIGSTTNGSRVYATRADVMPDGSFRMFLRLEKEMERKPEGIFAMFKTPEKYVEKSDPFSVLVHCKKRAVRDYKAGPLGSEFHVPWEPVMPGSTGAQAFNAFCKK